MSGKLAFTCGDPAGVGPEIIAAWLTAHADAASEVAVLGPATWLATLTTRADKIAVGLAEFSATLGVPSGEGALVAAECGGDEAVDGMGGEFSAES